MIFYLGTHKLAWLHRTDVPLFVSAEQLRRQKSFRKASARRAFDSGGFSQLNLHGRWTVDDRQLADEVTYWSEAVGMPDFVPCRDWMCEPMMLAKTGLSIADHQARTIESYINLMAIAPQLPWMPVLQGWECDSYLDHIDQYARAGVDLTSLPVVGVGTICKRQSSKKAARIIRAIAMQGVRIHAFGVKADGVRLFGDFIESADSMAWSYGARRRKRLLPECAIENQGKPKRRQHKNCANCMRYAIRWRADVLACVTPALDYDCFSGEPPPA